MHTVVTGGDQVSTGGPNIRTEWATLSEVEESDTLMFLFARSGGAGRALATMRKVGIVASSLSVPRP